MNAMPPLMPAAVVLERRFRPVWFALAFAGGAVNATALAACQRFVSHVTGSLTRFAMDYANLRLLLDYGAVLGAFVAGAMASYLFLDGRRLRERAPSVATPLGIVSLMLVAVALAGRAGAFGPFGQTVETNGDFVMLALLAFAMGLQNASIATVSGMLVRTTHMSGPLTDFSIACSVYLGAKTGSTQEVARRALALRAIKLGGFLSGAATAAILASKFDYFAFLLPAAVVGASGLWLAHSTARDPARALRASESMSSPVSSR